MWGVKAGVYTCHRLRMQNYQESVPYICGPIRVMVCTAASLNKAILLEERSQVHEAAGLRPDALHVYGAPVLAPAFDKLTIRGRMVCTTRAH